MDDRQAKRALVERGLERAGDAIGDITAPLMERFYAAFPDAEASFDHHGLGRRALLEAEMVGNVAYCLMTWFDFNTNDAEVVINRMKAFMEHVAPLFKNT